MSTPKMIFLCLLFVVGIGLFSYGTSTLIRCPTPSHEETRIRDLEIKEKVLEETWAEALKGDDWSAVSSARDALRQVRLELRIRRAPR